MTADLRNGAGGGRHGRHGPRPRIVPWLLLGLGLTLEMPLALADNQVTNGNFESGDLGFQSQYSNGCPKDIGAGCYKVTTSPFQWHQAFDSCGDHTTGSGNMLVANGAPTATYVWQQSVPVSTNTNYLFTAYARTVYPYDQYPANLRIQMDTAGGCGESNSFEDIGSINAPMGSAQGGPVCSDPQAWVTNYAATSIASGGSTSICIRILNDNTANAGNDFALDDISLAVDERVIVTANDSATTSGTFAVTMDVLGNDTIGTEYADIDTIDLNPGEVGVQTELFIEGTGTFAVVADEGLVTFTADAEFTGDATATYRVSTVNGIPSTVATITVKVEPICGPGIAYNTTGKWQQFALPCIPDASPVSIAKVLGNATTDAVNLLDTSYGSQWILFGRNAANSGNVQLSKDATLASKAGYWFNSYTAPTDNKLQIKTGSATPVETGIEGCLSDHGCAVIPVATSSAGTRMIGNPFPFNVDWSMVRVRVVSADKTFLYLPHEAHADNILDKQIWIWNGNDYTTWDDDAEKGNLQYFKSFFIKVLPGGVNKTIDLLIPAEASTVPVTAVPAGFAGRLADLPRAWGQALLDWLIPPAAAEALPDASGEWKVRLRVENAKSGAKTRALLGQRLDAEPGYDPADLTALAPFASPYLTLVLPQPGWGANKGDYTSDFRPADGAPAQWKLELRSNPAGSQVVLRWEADPQVLARSRLIDGKTVIDPTHPAYANGYPLTLTTKVRPLIWEYLGD